MNTLKPANTVTVTSEEFEMEIGDLCFVVGGCAFGVSTQGCTPFNNAAGIPQSEDPRLGHICDGTYYYPTTEEGKMEAGWTKKAWADFGAFLFRVRAGNIYARA